MLEGGPGSHVWACWECANESTLNWTVGTVPIWGGQTILRPFLFILEIFIGGDDNTKTIKISNFLR